MGIIIYNCIRWILHPRGTAKEKKQNSTCINCGNETAKDDNFCVTCGRSQEQPHPELL